MIIKQEELEKICLNLYPYFFDYKDITLHDINIKIDDYLHVKANLNYYNIETKIKAIASLIILINSGCLEIPPPIKMISGS